MSTRLLFFRGTSWVSEAIKGFHRGDYSHVGLLTPQGSIIESWYKGGVQENLLAHAPHTPGTVVDVYRVREELVYIDHGRLLGWLRGEVGKGYDWKGVVRFLFRSSRDDKKRWFCSELIAAAFVDQGRPLLFTEAHLVSPSVLAWSPLLVYERSFATGGK